MGNIIIFTMGTRGDIQPYIYLAKALIKAGHKVTIGTHPYWVNTIAGYGVEFAPIGPDVDIEGEAAIIRGKTKNPVVSMLKTMKFIFKIIEESSKDIYKQCRNKDLVIVSHSNMGAIEAEALNIKTVNVTLQTEVIPETFKDKSAFKKISDGLINTCINSLMVSPYNKIRKEYQLKKIKSIEQIMSPSLNLIPISSYVIEQNPYWEEKNKVVGYWFEGNESYEADEELKRFLSEGDKPIILALGAMSFEDVEEKEKLDIFVNSFKKTKMRAVIQGFNKTLKNYELPDTMISVGSIPHSWLFKQGYFVIHHGGFGTSSSAMLYGSPSIIIPHVLDQFALADRLYKLGVAVKPIKANEISEEKLTEAIYKLQHDYKSISENVRILSEKMQKEKGLDNAVHLINQVLKME